MAAEALRVGLIYDDTIDRPGGIGLYVLTLGAALQRREHHVEYLLGNTRQSIVGGAEAYSLARNVNVRFNGNSLSVPARTNGRCLDQALRRGRYDVLHVQVPYSPLMAGRLLSRASSSTAVVGTYHVASDRKLAQAGALALRALKQRSAWRFDALMAVSQTAADFARNWSRMPVSAVIPNLLDLSACRSGRRKQAQRHDVLFVGRLVPRKGAEQLVAAMPEIHQARGHNTTRLTLIGDGPLRGRLERQVRRMGLQASVTFLGEVDDLTKFEALSGARIACFPSLYGESFGMVLLEALAAGAEAVVAGANPGYAELLGHTAALANPRDSRDLGLRIAGLLDDDVGRRRLGREQRRGIERFDSARVVQQILAVYEGALAARRQTDDLRAFGTISDADA